MLVPIGDLHRAAACSRLTVCFIVKNAKEFSTSLRSGSSGERILRFLRASVMQPSHVEAACEWRRCRTWEDRGRESCGGGGIRFQLTRPDGVEIHLAISRRLTNANTKRDARPSPHVTLCESQPGYWLMERSARCPNSGVLFCLQFNRASSPCDIGASRIVRQTWCSLRAASGRPNPAWCRCGARRSRAG